MAAPVAFEPLIHMGKPPAAPDQKGRFKGLKFQGPRPARGLRGSGRIEPMPFGVLASLLRLGKALLDKVPLGQMLLSKLVLGKMRLDKTGKRLGDARPCAGTVNAFDSPVVIWP